MRLPCFNVPQPPLAAQATDTLTAVSLPLQISVYAYVAAMVAMQLPLPHRAVLTGLWCRAWQVCAGHLLTVDISQLAWGLSL